MKGSTRFRFGWTLLSLLIVVSLVMPWTAFADVFVWDGDVVTAGNQTTVNLDPVSPGTIITKAISFQLECKGKQHVDEGQTVGITFNLADSTVPGGGSLAATDASIGAIPSYWPDDTTGGGSTNCPSPAPLLDDNGNSLATITAPTTPGSYTFVVVYSSSLSPGGAGDPQAITGPNPSVTFNLVVQAPSDTTPPEISCDVPDQTIWYGADVTVACTASDPSGLKCSSDASFTLSTSVGSGIETSSADTGSKSVCDIYDNCAQAGPYTFKVDKKAPTGITFVGGPDDEGSYYFGFVPDAPTCTATDGGSGLASCAVTGYSSLVGTHTLTAKATDNVGNWDTATRSYTVLAWTLYGFYQPVDMGTNVWNTVKGGATVPLKFEVFAGSTELTEVSVVKSFSAVPTACPVSGYVADDIEFTTTGGTALRYDLTGGQFIQNWQTPKKPGACYKVTMTTQDGSTLEALFKLK